MGGERKAEIARHLVQTSHGCRPGLLRSRGFERGFKALRNDRETVSVPRRRLRRFYEASCRERRTAPRQQKVRAALRHASGRVRNSAFFLSSAMGRANQSIKGGPRPPFIVITIYPKSSLIAGTIS